MQETMETTQLQSVQNFVLPEIPAATDADILAYLRRSYKIAEIAAKVERDALILSLCEKFGIAVSEEELQAAGNAFRLEHKLLGSAETFAWLSQQRITVEDWSSGIRVALLEKKLKEHLFEERVDAYYLNNRNDYKRVALSQILVNDLTDAFKIVQALREENASFCALALEYSKGRQAREKGGFAGIHFLSRLMSEVAQAVSEAKEGEVLGPIKTKLGFHIIKVEMCFPPELSESVREEIFESMFQAWLRERSNSIHRASLHQ